MREFLRAHATNPSRQTGRVGMHNSSWLYWLARNCVRLLAILPHIMRVLSLLFATLAGVIGAQNTPILLYDGHLSYTKFNECEDKNNLSEKRSKKTLFTDRNSTFFEPFLSNPIDLIELTERASYAGQRWRKKTGINQVSRPPIFGENVAQSKFNRIESDSFFLVID